MIDCQSERKGTNFFSSVSPVARIQPSESHYCNKNLEKTERKFKNQMEKNAYLSKGEK